MKKFTKFSFFLLVCCLLSLGLKAQTAAEYTFAASSGTFTPLTGGTSAANIIATSDDDLSAALPIGFTFKYAGTDYTTVKVSSNGLLCFGVGNAGGTSNNLATTTTSYRPGLAPLWDDLQCRAGINYQTSGMTPNQVFTTEWLNMEWNYNATGAVISFQVKLYETTNVVEFVYRQEATAYNSGSSGASIGIMGTATNNFISLQNTSAAPTTSTATSTNSIATKPATGQVYTFTPPLPTAPNCSTLTNPANAATGVAINTNLTWTTATGTPTGYRLKIGTTMGGSEFLAETDVMNVTTYNPSPDFAYSTTYYVNITPYNAIGDAVGCTEQSFTTLADPTIPVDCTGSPVTGTYCYTNSTNQEFLFQSSDGSDLKITFNAGTVENTFDEIFVYDGPDATAPLLNAGMLYGNAGNLAGLSYTSTNATGHLFIRLTPDSSTDCNGGSQTAISYTVQCLSCIPAAGTRILGTCNAGASTFMVDVNVTDLGDGTVNITNNVDANVTTVMATGVVSVGPFPFGSVTITLGHPSDPTCNVALPALTISVCPPVNDECANATALTVDADLSCTSAVAGTTIDATQSLAGCNGTANDDVWYSFVATGTAHTITVNNTSGATDIVTQVFNACGGTSLVCQDSPDSPISLIGLTPSSTYYFRIYTWSATSSVRTSFNVCVGTPPPPPANDNCSSPTMLTESTDNTCVNKISGTTVSATKSTETTLCSTTANNDDVWYTFTPSQTNTYFFNITNTTSTTYVNIYSGTCAGGLTTVGSSCATSNNTANLTMGTTYLVQVYTSSTTVGTASAFDLCAYPAPPPPANDACASPITLMESPNFTCANKVSGTTISATQSTPTTLCSTTANNDDVWYSFTPSLTATYNFNITNTTSTTYVNVYSGTCAGGLTSVGSSCTSSSITASLTMGTTYLVEVYTSSTGATTYSNFDLCAYPQAPNDACANYIDITCAATPVAGSTTGSTVDAEYTNCGAGGTNTTERGVWYRYVGDDQEVTITTCDPSGIGYDTRLTVFSGSCGSFTCVAANDDMTPQCTTPTTGFRSEVSFNAFSGTDYYIFVHGFQSGTGLSATGNFYLNLSCTMLCLPIPDNEDCATATALTPNADYTCATPTVGENTCATAPLTNPSCFSAFATLPDVWYSFVAASTAQNVVVNYNTATSLGLVLYDACAGTELGCATALTDGADIIITGLTVGVTYYLQVLSTASDAGSFDICVLNGSPANDLCADAEDISSIVANGGMITGSTIGASAADAPNDCAATPLGAGVWYSINYGGGESEITLSVDAGNTLYVYNGTPCNVTGCATNATGQGTNSITFNTLGNAPAFGGTPFSVYVGGAAQDFTLTAANSPVLPISLIQFSAKENGKVNVIEWTTATEIDVKDYIIERSFNGRTAWETIGKTTAAGHTNTATDYEMIDQAPKALSYYRLRSIDLNRSEQLSNIVVVERKGEVDIVVYPIPTQEEVNLEFNGSAEKVVLITLTDVTGKMIQQYHLTAVDGLNKTTLSLATFSNGIYFLTLDNGVGKVTHRIIKQ